MPDTGAPWNIPYVENADLVRDWPADSLLVANAVAAGLSAAGNPGIGSNVVSTLKTDTFSTASTSFVTVTGLSATITPTSASSKVLVIVTLGYVDVSVVSFAKFRLMRDSTPIAIADADGVRTRSSFSATITADRGYSQGIVALDSPSTTSPTVYSLETAGESGTLYVNRRDNDSNNVTISRSASSITVIEVAA